MESYGIKCKRLKLITKTKVNIAEGVNCPRRGLAIRNAVRQTYLIELEKLTSAIRRQVLSQMIQRIESKAVYEAILANPDVCGSIEHDGLVSRRKISWNHPYLKLKRKH